MGSPTDGDCGVWCVNECTSESKLDTVTAFACIHTQAYTHMCTHIGRMLIIPNPKHGGQGGGAREQKH